MAGCVTDSLLNVTADLTRELIGCWVLCGGVHPQVKLPTPQEASDRCSTVVLKCPF